MIEALIVFLIAGSLGGILVGLLGAGVGLVVVPMLSFVLPRIGVPESLSMHMALGTSLAVIIVTTGSSVVRHHINGYVVWDVLTRLAPGCILGALVGSEVVRYMPAETLRIMFGIFMLLIAAKMVFELMPKAKKDIPRTSILFSGATGISALSSVLGVGGGVFMVPFLSRFKLSMHNIVATSTACSFFIGLAGVSGYIISGWHVEGLPAWSSGFVYWPAFLGITVTSIIFAQLGALIGNRLPSKVLRILFSFIIVIVGVKMLMG